MNGLGVFTLISATLVLAGGGALVIWRVRHYTPDQEPRRRAVGERTHYATRYEALGITTPKHGVVSRAAEAEGAGADATEFMSLAEMGVAPRPAAPSDGTELVDMVTLIDPRQR